MGVEIVVLVGGAAVLLVASVAILGVGLGFIRKKRARADSDGATHDAS